MNDSQKIWRKKLACLNQVRAKEFLSGSDIRPKLDSAFLNKLTTRCAEIFVKLNPAVHTSIAQSDISIFVASQILATTQKLKKAGLLPKLNNHGRRSECMAFNWLRGYATLMFFMPAIESMFSVRREDITFAGKDHELDANSFKKSPLADITIRKGQRVEVQAGFQGKNDIKKHKIVQALEQSKHDQTTTILLHFDIFNGRAAVINISNLGNNNPNYIQRAGMEGKTVMEIPDAWFNWDLTMPIPPNILSLTNQNLPRPGSPPE